MTFGEQNTEKEAHDILSYAFDRGINALDTAEAVSCVLPIFICICHVCLDVAEIFRFFFFIYFHLICFPCEMIYYSVKEINYSKRYDCMECLGEERLDTYGAKLPK